MKKLVMRSQKWLSLCHKRSCTVYNWLRSLLRPPYFVVTHYIRTRSALRKLCRAQKLINGLAKRKESFKIEETNPNFRMGGIPRPFASSARLSMFRQVLNESVSKPICRFIEMF